jgi:hypothetical protein
MQTGAPDWPQSSGTVAPPSPMAAPSLTGLRLAPDWPQSGAPGRPKSVAPGWTPDRSQTGPRLAPDCLDWPQTDPRLVPDWPASQTDSPQTGPGLVQSGAPSLTGLRLAPDWPQTGSRPCIRSALPTPTPVKNAPTLLRAHRMLGPSAAYGTWRLTLLPIRHVMAGLRERETSATALRCQRGATVATSCLPLCTWCCAALSEPFNARLLTACGYISAQVCRAVLLSSRLLGPPVWCPQ